MRYNIKFQISNIFISDNIWALFEPFQAKTYYCCDNYQEHICCYFESFQVTDYINNNS